MLGGDSDFQFSKNVICYKQFDNKLVLLLATNIEGMDGTSNVMRRTKVSATKTPVSCPNIIKIYNESTGGVDVIHQKTAAYQLDRKSRFRFYLRIFSSLIGITIVNSRIVYTKVGNSISLLDFKIVVVKSLLGSYINQQRPFCFFFEQNKQPKSIGDINSLPKEIPTHVLEFTWKFMRCNFCKNEGVDPEKFVSRPTCGLYLRCTKERNCFLKHYFQILYNTYIVIL